MNVVIIRMASILEDWMNGHREHNQKEIGTGPKKIFVVADDFVIPVQNQKVLIDVI